MPKLLQINITANWGSHGKIAESLGVMAISHGWESHIAFGRWYNKSLSHLYHIGSMTDEYIHGIISRLADNHGLMSTGPTKKLIEYIRQVNPDIIHIHNIHGYYLNYPLLFRYLSECGKPVVWTLHDCWPFTGHCAHYMFAGCEKWKTECGNCQLLSNYPASIFLDRSKRNFQKKKQSFLSVKDLTLVPVSHWLEAQLSQSFLQSKPIHMIHNGIDTERFSHQEQSIDFYKKYGLELSGNIILGVASNWYRKGLDDFIAIRHLLPQSYQIILVGLNKKERKALPQNIIGIERTENVDELVALYSVANVFFNPTWEDNFPTTNLEAMACGTPVITYDTGGSPEAIDLHTGIVIERGNLNAATAAIVHVCNSGKNHYMTACRNKVTNEFTNQKMLANYMNLYDTVLSRQI